MSLILPVPLIAVATRRTHSGRVAWVYGDNRKSDKTGFVGQEHSQLRERPVGQARSLILANCCFTSGSDAGQFFNCQPLPFAKCLGDDLFADNVVCMGLESSLPPANFSESATRSPGVSPLVGFSGTGRSLADDINLFTAELRAVISCGNMHNSQVNTNKVFDFHRRSFLDVNCGNQVEPTVSFHKIALPLDAVEPFGLIFAINHVDGLTPLNSCEANFIETFETHIPLVIGHRPFRAKDRTSCLVAGEAFNSLADGPHGELGRELKSTANFKVGQPVNTRLAEYASSESAMGRKSCGLVKYSHRVHQQRGLTRRRQQLELDGQFHDDSIRSVLLHSQEKILK